MRFLEIQNPRWNKHNDVWVLLVPAFPRDFFLRNGTGHQPVIAFADAKKSEKKHCW